MNLIIERLGQETIAPHVAGILPLLPRIWQAAADQSLLRIQVGKLCCCFASDDSQVLGHSKVRSLRQLL
jgi:hypothetical protein